MLKCYYNFVSVLPWKSSKQSTKLHWFCTVYWRNRYSVDSFIISLDIKQCQTSSKTHVWWTAGSVVWTYKQTALQKPQKQMFKLYIHHWTIYTMFKKEWPYKDFSTVLVNINWFQTNLEGAGHEYAWLTPSNCLIKMSEICQGEKILRLSPAFPFKRQV